MDKISREEWINNLCRNHMVTNTRDLSTEQVLKWMTDYINAYGSTCTEESFRRMLRKGKKNYLMESGMLEEDDIKEPDEQLIEANVRFKKEKQKFMDTNRVERASFREYARIENAVSEYAQELLKLYTKHGKQLEKVNPAKMQPKEGKEVGFIQVTDNHLNELIDLPHNTFDIRVASHRLFKLHKEAITMFKARGIEEIVVAFTGDLLNSDRRLDELLNQATNRSRATFIAVDLYRQFLIALSNEFKISVVSVLGNESRVNKEMPFSEEGLSDNYDFVIINTVRLLIEASHNPNITFGSLDEVETIIEIKGQKILLTHDLPRATASQKGAQSLVGMKYLQGQPVDAIFGGHIHETLNQSFGYRSGSLCGGNSFSDNALHLASRASQNIAIFGEGYRHVMGIDLQNTTEGEWFDIDESLMAYHAKSIEKTKRKEKILSIVI